MEAAGTLAADGALPFVESIGRVGAESLGRPGVSIKVSSEWAVVGQHSAEAIRAHRPKLKFRTMLHLRPHQNPEYLSHLGKVVSKLDWVQMS